MYSLLSSLFTPFRLQNYYNSFSKNHDSDLSEIDESARIESYEDISSAIPSENLDSNSYQKELNSSVSYGRRGENEITRKSSGSVNFGRKFKKDTILNSSESKFSDYKITEQLISEKLDDRITKIKQILDAREEENPLFCHLLNKSFMYASPKGSIVRKATSIQRVLDSIIRNVCCLKQEESSVSRNEIFSKIKLSIDLYVEGLNYLKKYQSSRSCTYSEFKIKNLEFQKIISCFTGGSKLMVSISSIVINLSEIEISLEKLEKCTRRSFEAIKIIELDLTEEEIDTLESARTGSYENISSAIPSQKNTKCKPFLLYSEIQEFIRKIEFITLKQKKESSFFISVLECSYFRENTPLCEGNSLEYKKSISSIISDLIFISKKLKKDSSDSAKKNAISDLKVKINLYRERLNYFHSSLNSFRSKIVKKTKESKEKFDSNSREIKSEEKNLEEINIGKDIEKFCSKDVGMLVGNLDREISEIDRKIKEESVIRREAALDLIPFYSIVNGIKTKNKKKCIPFYPFFKGVNSVLKFKKERLQIERETLSIVGSEFNKDVIESLKIQKENNIKNIKLDKKNNDHKTSDLSKIIMNCQKNISDFEYAIKIIEDNSPFRSKNYDSAIIDILSNVFFSLQYIESLQGDYKEMFE